YRNDDDGSVGWPTQAFRTAEKAEAHRLQMEREARDGENPFRFGNRWSLLSTTHDRDSMLALVRHLGLPEPRGYGGVGEPSLQDWEGWWSARKKAGLSDEQAERIWEALDRVTFYEVVPLRLGGDAP